MKKFLSEKSKIGIIIALVLLSTITGYYAYLLREKYINTKLAAFFLSFISI